MIKNCKHCGKPFDTATTWQEFDTDACRVAYFREKKKKDQQKEKDQKPKVYEAYPID